MLRGRGAARTGNETTTQQEVESTLIDHVRTTAPPGRHRRGRGRHLAPIRRSSVPIQKAALALAVAALMAVGSGLWFPRATSNATVREVDEADPLRVRSLETTTAPAAPSRICPIDWRRSTWHVKKLIRCAAAAHGVNQQKALYIAWRESRYQPGAYNAFGRAAGVYQHLLRYWPERAVDFGYANWSAFNARANIMVTMRMVRRYGWDPWGG